VDWGTPLQRPSQWRATVKDKAVKREFMMNEKVRQRANPFSEVVRWAFIAPVARDKIVISHWRFPYQTFTPFGSSLGP